MNELDIYIMAYNKKFSENFAGFYFKNLTTKETINMIKNCLEKEKDIYELGYVDLNKNVLY